MTFKQLSLLKSLVLLPSPSGFEKDMAEFISSQVPKQGCTIDIDRQNNVSVVIPGKTTSTVMIDAHMDQVGFCVCNVDDHGHISIAPIGGPDPAVLSAKHLRILTRKGVVNAVVNRKAAHHADIEEELVRRPFDAVVDIGIRDRDNVLSVVEIGDPVVFRPEFERLRGQYYTGCGLDDKVACFVLLETIQKIVQSRRKPSVTLVFTFSSQEETAGRKCCPLVQRFDPDLFIELDVTFATDWDLERYEYERELGRCLLGSGPVLYRGVDIHRGSSDHFQWVARNHRIPLQYQAALGSLELGYTATEVTHMNAGFGAMVIGIPLRNMHSPVEIVHAKDLTSSTKLLTTALLHSKLSKAL